MNLNKDILIGFGVGLFTGGGAGVLIATKHAEARATEEINSVKEEFRALMAQTTKRVDEMDKVIEKAGEQGFIFNEEPHEGERVSDEKLEELRQKLTAGPPIGEAESVTVQSDLSHEESKARIYAEQEKIDLDGSEPYVITVDQFQDEHVTGTDEHDKQTITYFEGDKKLVDGRDMLIKDTKGMVGDVFGRFGEGTDGEDHIVYVRNCWMGVDFEIVREEGTYEAYMTHQEDDWENEDVKPPVLRMRRD